MQREASGPRGADDARADDGGVVFHDRRGWTGGSADLLEVEHVAHLVGAHDVDVHGLENHGGPLDELGVGGLHTLGEVEVVLEPDPDVGTDQGGRGDVLELTAPDRERRVVPVRRARC